MDTYNVFVTSADTTIKCSAFLNDAFGTAILSVQQSNYFQTTYDDAIGGLIEFKSQYINGIKPPADPVLDLTSMVGIFIVYVIVIGFVLFVHFGMRLYMHMFPTRPKDTISNEDNNYNDRELEKMRGLQDGVPDEWTNAEVDDNHSINNNNNSNSNNNDDEGTVPSTLVATALSPFRKGGILDIGPVTNVMPDLSSWDVTMGLQQQTMNTMNLLTGSALSAPPNDSITNNPPRLEQSDVNDGMALPSSSTLSLSSYYDDRGPPPPIPPPQTYGNTNPSSTRPPPMFLTPRKQKGTSSQSDVLSTRQQQTTPWGAPPTVLSPPPAIQPSPHPSINQVPYQPSDQSSYQPLSNQSSYQPLSTQSPSNQRWSDVTRPQQPFAV